MTREIDEEWIEQAVERYRRIDAMLADFDKAIKRVEGNLQGRTHADQSRSIRHAVTAAADAAAWSRQKLNAENFTDYRPLT